MSNNPGIENLLRHMKDGQIFIVEVLNNKDQTKPVKKYAKRLQTLYERIITLYEKHKFAEKLHSKRVDRLSDKIASDGYTFLLAVTRFKESLRQTNPESSA